MYTKDLDNRVVLRLSDSDMDMLRKMSSDTGLTVSGCIRSILGEYRRARQTMDLMSRALDVVEQNERKGVMFNGDTITDFDNIV